MDLKDLKVELKRHYGKQGILLSGQTVEVDVDMRQCFVFCNGQRVGIYCGIETEPGKYLSFTDIPPLPQVMQKAIAEQVAAQVGGISHFSGVAEEPQELEGENEPE